MSSAELEGVALPEGWTAEPFGDAVVIVAPGAGGGGVTVNFKLRGFSLGWRHVRPSSSGIYRGRGWKQDLVRAAINHLRGAIQ
jgi:hypothetical protein